jgi:hypothetical protein
MSRFANHLARPTWANTIQQKTGKRLLGFPSGPQGLMHRFFEDSQSDAAQRATNQPHSRRAGFR